LKSAFAVAKPELPEAAAVLLPPLLLLPPDALVDEDEDEDDPQPAMTSASAARAIARNPKRSRVDLIVVSSSRVATSR
jgi:hypothetical protein